jgi:hypothetical protein
MSGQIFGSALRYPWALVKHGSNQPNGRRPGSSVAYLTDDEGDHYLGGFVWYERRRGQWFYRYAHARKLPKSDVLHIFPNGKSRTDGPSAAQIALAKRAVPKSRDEG